MAHPDAPFRLDDQTPEQAYRDGASVGRSPKCRDVINPGGPWVPPLDHDTDPAWIEYCTRKAACRIEWLRGFHDARAKVQA